MEGEELFCLEGFYTNGCGGCFPPDVTEDEYYYYMTEGGCGYAKVLGEKAFLEQKHVPVQYSVQRLS